MASGAPASLLSVNDEGHAAVRAVERTAALPAKNRRRESAAIEQNERLLLPRESIAQRLLQGTPENDIGPLLRKFSPHVDDRDLRQRTIVDSPLQHDPRVAASHGVVMAFHRRCRRAQDDQRAGSLPSYDGDIPAVIARTLFLLVRGIVLLIDDDEADSIEGREDGRPRANDDVHVTLTNPLPLIMALTRGETAVLNGHVMSERAAECGCGPWRESNLWNQHEHRPPGCAHVLGQSHVHLGLAAARHAVQQRHAERARVGHVRQTSKGCRLLIGQ